MKRIMEWFDSSLMIKIGAGLTLMAVLMLGSIGGVFLLIQQQRTGSTVVNIAGRQRMLSQRMERLALQAARGDEDAAQELADAADLFETSLHGLRDGDAAMGLPPAPSNIVPQFDKVEELWHPYQSDLQTVVQGADDAHKVQTLATEIHGDSEELLRASDELVKRLSGQGASHSAIDLADRQRMLSIRMAERALEIALGGTEEANALLEDARTFEQALNTLHDGDPNLDIPAATHDAKEQVEAIGAVWRPFHSNLQALATAADKYGAALAAAESVSGSSDELLKSSDEAVTLFERSAQSKVATLQKFLAGTLVAFLGVFALVLGRTTRQAVRPVGEVASALERITAQDLTAFQSALEAVAKGDLTREVGIQARQIDVDSADEVGQMARAFNQMVGRLQEAGQAFNATMAGLRNLVSNVQGDASSVASASGQISGAAEQAGGATQQIAATIQQVAQGAARQSEKVMEARSNVEQVARASDGVARGAQEQAESVQQTSDLITEMADPIAQMEQVADSVSEASARVTEAARGGVTAVEQTREGMQTIQGRTTEAAEKVREMGERSAEIGRIVEMIDDIADKTDMLALNAAVEAARAGEHGRGFAVVADQVRKLSEDSKAATRDIAQLIEGVQATVREAVAAMEATGSEVDGGTRLAEETARSLEDILQAAEDAARQVNQVAGAVQQVKEKSEGVIEAIESVSAVVEENTAAAEEMAAGSQEVTEAMEGVASVAQETSAAAEEVSAASEEMAAQVEQVQASTQSLSEMAQTLQTLVRQFKISASTTLEEERDVIETFKQAHRNWVHRVEEMLAGGEVFEPHSHTECSLGRWYQGRGQLEWGHLSEFEALDAPHAELHGLLKDIVTAHTRSDQQRAEALFEQMKQVSQRVVSALDELEWRIARELGQGEVSLRAPKATPRIEGDGQRYRMERQVPAGVS